LTREAKVSGVGSTAVANDDDDDEFTRVDMIHSIEEHNIQSLEPVIEKKPLVIPLIPTRSYDAIKDVNHKGLQSGVTATCTDRVKHEAVDSNGVSTGAAIDSMKLEDLATLELLQELKTEGRGDSSSSLYSRSNLVIKSSTTNTHTDNDDNTIDGRDSAHDGSHIGGAVKRKAPLLMLHVAPELLLIKDETERFKYDMSQRAEDMSIRSEAYEHVPIEEFGAALLRGMGWKEEDTDGTTATARRIGFKKGDDDNGKEEQVSRVVPRERNLGLGAMPKPPALKGINNNNNKGVHSKDKDRQKDEAALDSQWRNKAADRLSSQRIAVGDVVWIVAVGTNSSSLAGKRAVVVTATGVAGLDRIR